jgi:hypothetical protein
MGEAREEMRFTINMPRETSYAYRIDGQEHPMQPGASGQSTGDVYVATWEGGALLIRSVGGSTFDQRRYMDGDEMVNELSFPAKGGISMTRRFVRQA